MTALSQLKIGDFVGFMDVDVALPIPKLWYLLRIHPNRELAVEHKLLDRGVSAWLPKEKRSVRSVWSRRVLRTTPLFPGLLFIPDFEADLRRLKSLAEGIVGYVKFGERTAAATPKVMASLRQLEAAVDIPPSLRPRAYAIGQLVRVLDGPFEMFEGRIERLDSHARLSVALTIFERETPVMLDEDQIEAV
jgi:transcriptional antiterminator NusG